LSEDVGFADFNHKTTVAYWLHAVNTIRVVLRWTT